MNKEIKGYIKKDGNSLIGLEFLEATISPFMEDGEVSKYVGLITFKVSEDYKDVDIPQFFDIEGFSNDELLYIENCKLKEKQSNGIYKARYKIENATIEEDKPTTIDEYIIKKLNDMSDTLKDIYQLIKKDKQVSNYTINIDGIQKKDFEKLLKNSINKDVQG